MLTPTEAAARNRALALKAANDMVARIENRVEEAIKRREHGKRREKSPLPMCNPKDRVFKRRTDKFVKVRTYTKAALPIATPAPVVKSAHVNGITSFHADKRVTQYAIDTAKVARYLAK